MSTHVDQYHRIRTTADVLADHVRCRRAGDLEGDLRYNYHRHVLLLSAEGVHHGHEGVRRLAAILRSYLADAGYEFHKTMTDGDLGMLVWSARCAGDDDYMHEGVDSYVIRDGMIAAQTTHYSPAHGDD
jgi:hypothetical protein